MSDFNISQNSLLRGMRNFSGSDRKLNVTEFNAMMTSMESHIKCETGFDDGVRSTASEKAMLFNMFDFDGDGQLSRFEQRKLSEFFTGNDGVMDLNNWWNVKNQVW